MRLALCRGSSRYGFQWSLNTFVVVVVIFSLFAQYALTFAAASTGTAYAVWRRPPNGIAIMLVAGAGGSLLDLAYGWNVACVNEVELWRRHQQQIAKVDVAKHNPETKSNGK